MIKEKLERLIELQPYFDEYNKIKKEIQLYAIEHEERYKGDEWTVSLSARSKFTPKFEVEEMEKIDPLAVVVKKEIDIDYLKELEDFEKYLDVEETISASIRLKK